MINVISKKRVVICIMNLQFGIGIEIAFLILLLPKLIGNEILYRIKYSFQFLIMFRANMANNGIYEARKRSRRKMQNTS